MTLILLVQVFINSLGSKFVEAFALKGFPHDSEDKESACNVEDLSLMPET